MSANLDLIAENRLLGNWARLLDRSPHQQNGFGETDAELIPLGGGDRLLAITIDSIAEEIALGLYRCPETMGWMAAAASLSDLAAVGAEPIGLVVSVNLPDADGDALQSGIARGLSAACRAAGTFILGGDTNAAERLSITGCAVGTVRRDRALRRMGCRPGDAVYATGLLGAGAAVAAAALLDLPSAVYDERMFRPRARLSEAQHLAPFVSAAMDTSDGLVATLDQLSRLNGVGFTVDTAAVDLLEPGARRVCETLGVPPLAMLAAHHGELELVLTVRAAARERFEAAARAAELSPVLLGRTTAEPSLRFDDKVVDGARIRNLAHHAGDPARYVRGLLALVGAPALVARPARELVRP
jgi:thiamine-monophosphate kinase